MKRLALTKKFQALMMASTLALGAFVMPGTLPAATEAVESFNTITISGYPNMSVGEVQKLKATADVTWQSGNTAVAEVNDNGVVTAISAGKATIKATAGSEKATFLITVGTVVVTDLEIELESTEMIQEGETQQLIAKVYPEEASNRVVSWKSSKPSVATIDKNGVVTAVAPGEVVFTATHVDGGKKVEAKSETVTVIPKTAKLSKLTRAEARYVDVKWAKVKGATGYQLQYAKDEDFDEGLKTKTVKKAKTVTARVNVKKKGTWYFQVRAYKTINGEKVYGEWSNVKSVKVP